MKRLKDYGYIKVKRLGNYLKLDLLYFLKGGFWLTLGNGVEILAGLIISIFLARFLSVDDYGAYQFVISVLAIITITSLPGINTAVLQATSHDKKILTKAVKTQFKWSFLGSAAFLFCAGYFYFIQFNILWKYFIFMALFFPFVKTFNTHYAFLAGKEEFKRRTAYQAITKAIHVAGMLTALIIFKSAFSAIVAYVLTISFSDILFFMIVKKKSNIGAEDKNAIDYGKKLTYIRIIPIVANNLDKIILSYFLGLDGLAIYSVALMIPQNINLSFKQLMPIFFRRLAHLEKKVFFEKIRQNLFFIILTLFIFAGVLALIMPHIIQIVFTSKYSKSAIYAQFLLFSILLVPFLFIFKSYLKIKKLTRQVFIQEITTSTADILLMLILISSFGIFGAVAAKIVSHLIGVFLSLYLISKTDL